MLNKIDKNANSSKTVHEILVFDFPYGKDISPGLPQEKLVALNFER